MNNLQYTADTNDYLQIQKLCKAIKVHWSAYTIQYVNILACTLTEYKHCHTKI